jgi:hypothetical protein
VYNPVEDHVDDAARARLRHAIVADDGDEEQLDGVMRMLGAAIPPEEDQLSLLEQAGRPSLRLAVGAGNEPNIS